MNFPTSPMGQHNRLMLAFNDDLLAGDCNYRGMKTVAEISRQTRAIAFGTVATRASPEPQEGLGHSASVELSQGSVSMMPRSARDGWLEELLDYLDQRQDINGGGGANDYMRWHDALKLAIDALEAIHGLADEGVDAVDVAIAQNAELVAAASKFASVARCAGPTTDLYWAACEQLEAVLANIGGDA